MRVFAGNGCYINVQRLRRHHALIIKPHDHSELLYPNADGYVEIAENDRVFLSCGQRSQLNEFQASSKTLKCINANLFEDDQKIYRIEEMYTCQEVVLSDIKNGRTLNSHEVKEIGFYTDDQNTFLTIVESYKDKGSKLTKYVKSTISKSVASVSLPRRRPSFDGHRRNLTSVRLRRRFYNADNQRTSIVNQLGTEYDRHLQKNRKTSLEFNRGHLTPRKSMICPAAAAATFTLHNEVPQSMMINSGNWNSIENHVRVMATVLQRDPIEVTGAHKQLQLKRNGDGPFVDMYLYAFDENPVDNKTLDGQLVCGKHLDAVSKESAEALPIPLYFFKLVFEPFSRKGVVYVTVNNPHMEDPSEFEVCRPITTEYRPDVKMPRWNLQDVAKGYSYMCSITDFVKKTGYVLEGIWGDGEEPIKYGKNGEILIDTSRISEDVLFIAPEESPRVRRAKPGIID